MKKVLLAAPKMENPRGGMAIWTDAYMSECHNFDLLVDVLNISTTGRRKKQGNAKRSMFDEIVRTTGIFYNLKKLLKNEKYDIAHINTSCGTFGLTRDYLIAKRVKKVSAETKIVTHFHCNIGEQVKYDLQKKTLAKLVKLTDEAIVLNSFSKKYLEKNYSASCWIAPNGVSEKLIIKNEKQINEKINTIVFVGYVQREKGAVEIIYLAEKNPDKKFILIGEVAAEIKEWKIPSNVEFKGLVAHEKIMHFLDEVDVFLFPTHTEGFSIALAEAMARGVPVITTEVGANMDMIENKGGVVVTVGDVQAMNDAINSMESCDIRKKMSLWNVDKVKSSYTVKAVMDRIKHIYGE